MVLYHLCLFSAWDYVCHSEHLGYYSIASVDVANIQIILTDNIDRCNDRLGPVDLMLFTLLLELVHLNLMLSKALQNFGGNLRCCTAPYVTISNNSTEKVDM